MYCLFYLGWHVKNPLLLEDELTVNLYAEIHYFYPVARSTVMSLVDITWCGEVVVTLPRSLS